MPSLRLVLPLLPMPALAPNQKHHHWTKARLVRDQADAWLWALKAALGPPPWPRFEGPVRLAFHLTGTGRRADIRSWAGHHGIKVLEDCLTDPRGQKQYGVGLLPDDSLKYVVATSVDVEPDGEPQTTLTIQEA